MTRTPLLLLLTLAATLHAQQTVHPGDAHRLAALARHQWAQPELADLGYLQADLDPSQAAQNLRHACLLLQAATQRDPENLVAAHDLCLLFTSPAINDPGRAADAISAYTALNPQDAHAVEIWLRFRLDHLPDRQSREAFLRQTLPLLADYPLVQSIALTELGLLALEKGLVEDLPGLPPSDSSRAEGILPSDSPRADQSPQPGARTLFTQAFYQSSFYNLQALDQLLALELPDLDAFTQGSPDQRQALLEDARQERILHIALRNRLALRNDPFDLNAARLLIDTLESLGKLALAQQYYPHLQYLLAQAGADQPLLRQLRLQQLTAAYAAGLYPQAADLATNLLNENPDDLLVSAVLALALRHLEQPQQAQQILENAATKALDRLAQQKTPSPDTTRTAPPMGELSAYPRTEGVPPNRRALLELAWFFAFIKPDPAQAIRLADQACSQPAPPRCQPIRAWAHLLADDTDQAADLLQSADPNDPLTALARARLLLDTDQPDAARALLETLDPASLGVLIDSARDLAARLPGDTPASLAAPDPNQFDLIDSAFAAQFDDNELRLARQPQHALSARIALESDIVPYGHPLNARIYLSNTSAANNLPANLLLGPGGFLDPHALITATVAPANQPARAQSFTLSHRYLLEQRLLPPGQSNAIPEYLNIGPLRDLLDDRPQQTFDITLQLILDPVPDPQGRFTSSIPALQPAALRITRSGFNPSSDRLGNLLRAANEGRPRERTAALQLLAALVREANLARQGRLDYQPNPVPVDTIIRTIAANTTNPDPRTRAWAAYELANLSTGLSPQHAAALTETLNDPDPFPRFLTVHALAPRTNLTPYLEFAANNESTDPLLQRQALLLLNQPWPPIPLPLPN